MKRSVLAALGCLVATAAFAQGPVYSVNVVGFNKLQLEKNKLYLISTAFEDINGNALKASDVFGSQVPSGTAINYYVGGVPPYRTDARASFGPNLGWGTNQTINFEGTMGFWLKMPNTGTQVVYDVVLKGQAPMDNTTSNVVVNGLNMLAYPYTADVHFTNTTLYATSLVGDTINVWNAARTNYVSPAYARTSFGPYRGWGAGVTNLWLRQGMGYWYRTTNALPRLITEVRPYPKNQ